MGLSATDRVLCVLWESEKAVGAETNQGEQVQSRAQRWELVCGCGQRPGWSMEKPQAEWGQGWFQDTAG